MSEKVLPVELRRLVATRARHYCADCRTQAHYCADCRTQAHYCADCRTQAHYSADPLTIDHITLRSVGDPTVAENLALCCHGYNQHKARRIAARDTVPDSLVSLCNSRTQNWEEHFAWHQELTLMLGLTPTGRATLTALHLNRSGLVNLRRVLYLVGEPPPRPQHPS